MHKRKSKHEYYKNSNPEGSIDILMKLALKTILFFSIAMALISVLSCDENHRTCEERPSLDIPPSPFLSKKILLKDIIIPNLPSPYYHFEYAEDSTLQFVSFGSGFNAYDVLHDGFKFIEMRNNIIVNHDTLRYAYDQDKRVQSIQFINDANEIYRQVLFCYDRQFLKEVRWLQKVNDSDFVTFRTVSLTYFTDDNAQQLTEHRPEFNGTPESGYTIQWEDYDDSTNVDDFMELHDGTHDHLFLPSGFRIQKNNPRKEIFSAIGGLAYTATYTYVYNEKGAPLVKNGSIVFSGSGQTFQSTTNYSYY